MIFLLLKPFAPLSISTLEVGISDLQLDKAYLKSGVLLRATARQQGRPLQWNLLKFRGLSEVFRCFMTKANLDKVLKFHPWMLGSYIDFNSGETSVLGMIRYLLHPG